MLKAKKLVQNQFFERIFEFVSDVDEFNCHLFFDRFFLKDNGREIWSNKLPLALT